MSSIVISFTVSSCLLYSLFGRRYMYQPVFWVFLSCKRPEVWGSICTKKTKRKRRESKAARLPDVSKVASFLTRNDFMRGMESPRLCRDLMTRDFWVHWLGYLDELMLNAIWSLWRSSRRTSSQRWKRFPADCHICSKGRISSRQLPLVKLVSVVFKSWSSWWS